MTRSAHVRSRRVYRMMPLDGGVRLQGGKVRWPMRLRDDRDDLRTRIVTDRTVRKYTRRTAGMDRTASGRSDLARIALYR